MRLNAGHLFSTDNHKTIKYEPIIRSNFETLNTKVKEHPKPIYTRVIFLPRISEILLLKCIITRTPLLSFYLSPYIELLHTHSVQLHLNPKPQPFLTLLTNIYLHYKKTDARFISLIHQILPRQQF